MSNETAISMRELEAESAELLPSRETLCRPSCGGGHGGSTVFQSGLVNINNSNVLSGNNIAIGNIGSVLQAV